MFPERAAGTGLFILRISIGAFVVLNLIPDTGLARPWEMTAIVVAAGLYLLGLLTPYVSGLCCVAEIVVLATGRDGSAASMVPWIMATAALAFTGPGGYSADARLFGPRLVMSTERASDRGRGGAAD